METKEKEFSSPHKFLNDSIRRPGVWFGFVKINDVHVLLGKIQELVV